MNWDNFKEWAKDKFGYACKEVNNFAFNFSTKSYDYVVRKAIYLNEDTVTIEANTVNGNFVFYKSSEVSNLKKMLELLYLE